MALVDRKGVLETSPIRHFRKNDHVGPGATLHVQEATF